MSWAVQTRLAASLLLAWAPLASAQAVLKVPATYPDIQSAVDAAAAGDTILVAPGHYAVSPITVNSKNLTIVSERGARDTELFVSTPGRCFTLIGTTTSGSTPMTIEGFKILNGHAPDGDPGIFGASGESGGAVLVLGGGAILRGCDFGSNRAGSGAFGGPGADGASQSAGGAPGLPGGAGGRGGDGGAVAFLNGATPATPSRIENCIFHENQAGSGADGGPGGNGGDDLFGTFGTFDPGGAGGAGGAGGRAGLGGAIMHAATARLDVINSTFRLNTLGVPGSGGHGGVGGSGFPSGTTGVDGGLGGLAVAGGIYTSTGDLHVLHSTLSENSDVGVFAVLPLFVPPSTFENSIAYFNGDLQDPDVPASITASFSDIQGGGTAGTNIDKFPEFVDDPIFDEPDWARHLKGFSPCLDSASSSLAATIAEDIDGDPRVLGTGPDMGSDERFELPGSGEDLELFLTIDGAKLDQTPGVTIYAGQIAVTKIWDGGFIPFVGKPFVGHPMLFALQPYPSGPPMGLNPFLLGSVMDPNLPGISLFGFGGGPLGPMILAPSGMDVAFQIPPGLEGTTVRLQGYVISPNAANGVWAGTNGIDLRIE